MAVVAVPCSGHSDGRHWRLNGDIVGCLALATHRVTWSDREMPVCDAHVQYARDAAARDGSSDRTDRPHVERFAQNEVVVKWWPEIVNRAESI